MILYGDLEPTEEADPQPCVVSQCSHCRTTWQPPVTDATRTLWVPARDPARSAQHAESDRPSRWNRQVRPATNGREAVPGHSPGHSATCSACAGQRTYCLAMMKWRNWAGSMRWSWLSSPDSSSISLMVPVTCAARHQPADLAVGVRRPPAGSPRLRS